MPHRVHPGLTFLAQPAPQRLSPRLGVDPTTRTLQQDLLITGVAFVDCWPVPCPSDDVGVAFPGGGASLQQDQGFDIHRPVGEQRALFSHGVGRNPNAVLQVAKTAVLKIEP